MPSKHSSCVVSCVPPTIEMESKAPLLRFDLDISGSFLPESYGLLNHAVATSNCTTIINTDLNNMTSNKLNHTRKSVTEKETDTRINLA